MKSSESSTTSDASSKPIMPYLWMLCGSGAFTVMAAMAHALREHCDWQVIGLARAGLVLVFALVLAWLARSRLVFLKPASLWTRSLAGSASMLCTFYALTHASHVSYVLTVTNMYPIWVAVLSWPMLREVPSLKVWFSVFIGIVGFAIVANSSSTTGYGPPSLTPGGHPVDASISASTITEENFSYLVALIASFCTAFAMLGLHLLHGVDTRAIVVHFSGVATVVMFGSLFLFERKAGFTKNLESSNLTLLLGVGVSATIGQLFLTKAFSDGPPAKVAVVGLSQVVFALLLDTIILGRSIGRMSLIGMFLVLAPTAWLMIEVRQKSSDS